MPGTAIGPSLAETDSGAGHHRLPALQGEVRALSENSPCSSARMTDTPFFERQKCPDQKAAAAPVPDQ
jgi:hypothetical protein